MTESPRILLVEDEPPIAQLQRQALEHAGFEVEDVGRGHQALECLALRDEYALVMLDYRLPDMTGADVIGAMGDRIGSLPVVVVTGYPDPEIERRMREAGVRDYIVKDIGMQYIDRLPQAAQAALA